MNDRSIFGDKAIASLEDLKQANSGSFVLELEAGSVSSEK